MRYFIGLVTAAALLAPFTALNGSLTDAVFTEQSKTGEGSVSLYLSYKLGQAAKETEKRLEKEFSLPSGTLCLTLNADGSDLAAVRLTGGTLSFSRKTDRFVKEAVLKRAEELLGCPVTETEGENG